MADELVKKVRLNNGVYVEAFQQGKRKYAVVTDGSEQFRGEKFKEPYTDDQVIKETYIAYARKNGKMFDYYKVIQDPYKDPWPIRTTYGNGDKSPYYLNNGCKINIQWIGRIPNPTFNPGTFSNPWDAEDAPGAPERWLYDQVITSSVDDASNRDTLPKSTWVIEQPFQINQVSGMSKPNYRDESWVNDKIVTVNLPDSVKEEGDYLVWTDGGLLYNTKSIPATASFESMRIERGFGIGGRPKDQITYYNDDWKDSDIVKRVIDDFKMKVSSIHGIYTNDYNLQLCVPDTASCSIIPYKSPLTADNKPPETPETNPPGPTMSATNPKVKFTLDGIADPIEVKVKTTLDTFIVWAGPIPKNTTDTDRFEELGELDEEYSETLFAGEEEKMAKIAALNQIDDEPAGPDFDNQLASEMGPVDKSNIGSGPVLGSKLTNKAGTSMINLAGHRLTPILKDLENYLNKNGYPGAKIGNNGVMRALRDSAYPNSPARAAASLHGAGLAIDVTFNVPGFKWKGIGDNGNLSKDANLTKVIANFVKGQGDITWGAVWGSGSKPSDGIVNGRGVTEYHHFEIRSDMIPSYWEPVKDELAKFGFKPSQLKSPGRGSNLHKLMLKLLGDA